MAAVHKILLLSGLIEEQMRSLAYTNSFQYTLSTGLERLLRMKEDYIDDLYKGAPPRPLTWLSGESHKNRTELGAYFQVAVNNASQIAVFGLEGAKRAKSGFPLEELEAWLQPDSPETLTALTYKATRDIPVVRDQQAFKDVEDRLKAGTRMDDSPFPQPSL